MMLITSFRSVELVGSMSRPQREWRRYLLTRDSSRRAFATRHSEYVPPVSQNRHRERKTINGNNAHSPASRHCFGRCAPGFPQHDRDTHYSPFIPNMDISPWPRRFRKRTYTCLVFGRQTRAPTMPPSSSTIDPESAPGVGITTLFAAEMRPSRPRPTRRRNGKTATTSDSETLRGDAEKWRHCPEATDRILATETLDEQCATEWKRRANRCSV
jgi:hypothetical protein